MTSSKCLACCLPHGNSCIVTVHVKDFFFNFTLCLKGVVQRDKEEGFQLYSFPHDEARRKQWGQALKLQTIDPVSGKSTNKVMATNKAFHTLYQVL